MKPVRIFLTSHDVHRNSGGQRHPPIRPGEHWRTYQMRFPGEALVRPGWLKITRQGPKSFVAISSIEGWDSRATLSVIARLTCWEQVHHHIRTLDENFRAPVRMASSVFLSQVAIRGHTRVNRSLRHFLIEEVSLLGQDVANFLLEHTPSRLPEARFLVPVSLTTTPLLTKLTRSLHTLSALPGQMREFRKVAKQIAATLCLSCTQSSPNARFIDAIHENPADVLCWSGYADFLQESSSPEEEYRGRCLESWLRIQ